METILQFLPLLIPLLIAQYALAIVAVIHVMKHPNYRFGSRIFWIIVVLAVNLIGPIAYFLIGQNPDKYEGDDE
jgi:hypothetical protein